MTTYSGRVNWIRKRKECPNKREEGRSGSVFPSSVVCVRIIENEIPIAMILLLHSLSLILQLIPLLVYYTPLAFTRPWPFCALANEV